MPAEDWDYLKQAFLAEKRRVIDAMDSSIEVIRFDFEAIKRDAQLVTIRTSCPFTGRR